ncbi:MAG: ABC transporter permease, partial [Saprospiraceae bacterium]|nr:ABC transporter permease [Saprospiraceae bacterium]
EEGKVSESFYETDGYAVDSSFFDIFKYDFTEGNPKTALTEPNMVVLTESMAKKIFPNQSAINQTIRISNTIGNLDYRVTGVVKDPKNPSHLNGHFFMSIYSGEIGEFVRDVTNMANNNFLYTYIRLKPGSDAAALERKFPAFVEKYAGKDLAGAGFQKKQFLQAVPAIHLHSDVDFEIGKQGDIKLVYILASIAILTLLIACINFMNLSTARSGTRANEVGIRKVMGAEKSNLIRQFIGESMLISLLSLLIAVVLVEIMLPTFNRVTGKELSLIAQPLDLLWFVAIALITGLLAGSYPAFYLSSFNPVTVLKGKLANTFSAVALRRGLVVFQFIISICLITGSLFINKQMNFLQNEDLGFEKEHQVVIPLRTETAEQICEAFKNELLRNPAIQNATAVTSHPGQAVVNDRMLYKQGQSREQAKRVVMNFVDYDYLQTINIQLNAGRFLSREFPADTTNRIVVNETTIRELGFKNAEEAVGQSLYFDWQGSTTPYEIIGVIKDFHHESLHNAITPYGMMLVNGENSPSPNYLIVHAQTNNMKNLLSLLEKSWKTLNPNEPFEYEFLNEAFQKNYETEQRISSILQYFTLFAIFISCLGLFGLAAFTAERRTKEIGIRKVLGASVGSIVTLLSREFLLLVGIAFLIATPIAWYAANRWLEGFAYRIPVQWWVFAIAGMLALAIALFTISFQAIRAAVANPVESLKNE